MPEQIPNVNLPKRKRYEVPTLESLAPQETVEECSQKIEVLKKLIEDFETAYVLEELHAIIGFNSLEERNNSLRAQAGKALSPIKELLREIQLQSAVPDTVKYDLQSRYQILSRAVGVITTDPTGTWFDLVDHTR